MPDNRPTAEDAKPGTCQVEMSDKLPCGRILYDAPDGIDFVPVCIMHSNHATKDFSVFNNEADAILNGTSTSHRLDIAYDFTRFVFPLLFLRLAGGRCKKQFRANGAKFLGGILCTGTVFEQFTDFSETKISASGFYWKAVFEQNMTFMGAQFLGPAHFRYSIFKREAEFGVCTFEDVCTFDEAEFCLGASFSHSTFNKATSFKKTLFWTGNDLEPGIPLSADFRHADFREPGKVRFFQVNKDLYEGVRFKFLNTQVEEIHLIDVNWNFFQGRLVLEDELTLRGAYADNDIGPFAQHHLIVNTYRQLIINFEKMRSYGLAEDCFIGAMEMRRLNPDYFPLGRWFWFEQLYLDYKWARKIGEWVSVSNTYRLASSYGSKYKQAFGVLLGLLVVFGFFYSLPGFGLSPTSDMAFLEGPYLEDDYSWQRLLDGILYAFEVITFTREPTFTVTNYLGKAVRILETIFVPAQLALFFLALRRRFRR